MEEGQIREALLAIEQEAKKVIPDEKAGQLCFEVGYLRSMIVSDLMGTGSLQKSVKNLIQEGDHAHQL